jgi:hypothetical protein
MLVLILNTFVLYTLALPTTTTDIQKKSLFSCLACFNPTTTDEIQIHHISQTKHLPLNSNDFEEYLVGNLFVSVDNEIISLGALDPHPPTYYIQVRNVVQVWVVNENDELYKFKTSRVGELDPAKIRDSNTLNSDINSNTLKSDNIFHPSNITPTKNTQMEVFMDGKLSLFKDMNQVYIQHQEHTYSIFKASDDDTKIFNFEKEVRGHISSMVHSLAFRHR